MTCSDQICGEDVVSTAFMAHPCLDGFGDLNPAPRLVYRRAALAFLPRNSIGSPGHSCFTSNNLPISTVHHLAVPVACPTMSSLSVSPNHDFSQN